MIVGAAVIATSFAAFAATAAAAPPPACVSGGAPPSDVNTYLMLGVSKFHTKGGNDGPGKRGFFTGGNVGVSAPGGELQVGANGRFMMPTDGTALVGDDSHIGDDEVNVYDVFANTVYSGFTSPKVTARHSGTNPLCISTLPVVTNLPATPPVTTGATDITVNDGDTLTLAPGSYGDLRVKDDAVLNLGDGTYDFKSFDAGKRVETNTTDHTVVNVKGALSTGNGSRLGSSDIAYFYVRGDGVDVNDFVVNFSVGGAEVHGTFWVPTGEGAMGNSTDFYGRYWGNSQHTDFDINFTYRAPATISGHKFEDIDGNGQQDAGDGGLAGVTFYVDYDDDGQLGAGEPSAQSDASGDYSISSVAPGTWTVREVAQSGYTCTYPSGCAYPGVTVGTNAVSNLHVDGKDFGNHKPPTPPTPPTPPNPPIPGPNPPTSTPGGGTKSGEGSGKSGSSRLTGRGGCTRVTTVRVKGSSIAKVRFTVDGRTIASHGRSPWTARVHTYRLTQGVHLVRANVTYDSGATKTLRMTVHRCAERVKPRLAG